ncbi:hypothetical protein AVEN_164005-1 [Araneus ventricosus]|uniref:Uncharacterized protein n=1 Tax=Araneus ventricosus TaxID=182803 RepID=A0A4Y2D899_ARAVE|nr:hypothetical protein AVEN_164005-1 [Araneus ventricosus]
MYYFLTLKYIVVIQTGFQLDPASPKTGPVWLHFHGRDSISQSSFPSRRQNFARTIPTRKGLEIEESSRGQRWGGLGVTCRHGTPLVVCPPDSSRLICHRPFHSKGPGNRNY